VSTVDLDQTAQRGSAITLGKGNRRRAAPILEAMAIPMLRNQAVDRRA
jgi:hypothetical protein